MPNFDVDPKKNHESAPFRGVPEVPSHFNAASGNERELLKVTSGKIVIIDQFMLANQQFIGPFVASFAESGITESGTDEAGHENLPASVCRRFGGALVDLRPGDYGVYRNAHERFMVIYPLVSGPERGTEESSSQTSVPDGYSGEVPVGKSAPYESLASIPPQVDVATVVLDTRAVVFVDATLLQNDSLRSEFLQLWQSSKRKEARDLLRSRGCAVRYGFSHYSDSLRVSTSNPGSDPEVPLPEGESVRSAELLIVTADRVGKIGGDDNGRSIA